MTPNALLSFSIGPPGWVWADLVNRILSLLIEPESLLMNYGVTSGVGVGVPMSTT